MVTRDALTVPEVGRRGVRQWEEIERRKPLTRLVSRGIHAPSRATVLIQIVHRESATGSYVSLPRGCAAPQAGRPRQEQHARSAGPARPQADWPGDRLGQRRPRAHPCQARPATLLIHQPSGEACPRFAARGFRDEVLADCAVKKTMGVTYMRHTAAM